MDRAFANCIMLRVVLDTTLSIASTKWEGCQEVVTAIGMVRPSSFYVNVSRKCYHRTMKKRVQVV